MRQSDMPQLHSNRKLTDIIMDIIPLHVSVALALQTLVSQGRCQALTRSNILRISVILSNETATLKFKTV